MENKRKCFKCGCSPAKDGVKLFRFPKPGETNLIRCLLWAKYIFPEKEYASLNFQKQLHSEHRMLCQRHFKNADFADNSKTKLLRTSVPNNGEPALRMYSSVGHSQQKPFCDISNLQNTETAPQRKAEGNEPVTRLSTVPYDHQAIENYQPVAGPSTAPPSQAQQTRENKLLGKCRKYMQKVCQLRNRLKNLKKKEMINVITEDIAVKKLSEKITPAFALLLQGQIRNFKKKVTGRRWLKEEKITALRIYKRSPTCYRLLRRLFPLPSTSTLKILLRKLPFGVGINKPMFAVLKRFAATQAPSDNYYTLMFDEISIKKHFQYNHKDDIIEGYQDHGTHGRSPTISSYALVFMISGIRKRLKQPIAHYFSSGFSTADRLAVLIKEVLYQCFEAGINVAAIVCDMDGVNRRAFTILGSTVEQPFIKVNNKEIVTFFDPPHLLKCFRNMFIKYNIEMPTHISSDGLVGKEKAWALITTPADIGMAIKKIILSTGIAKWYHIKEFYEVDSTNPNFVYAPVLKKDHLDPNSKQKMKVNLAAQVLSHSVAGGMLARISNGSISTEAAVTASLVADMDKLFDLMNADSPDLRRGKPHSTNWSSTSPHTEIFMKMKVFFQTMKFIGSPRKPPSQDGWLTTLNAFLRLRKNLEAVNITRLATRRLQQDPIENLFGCIRGNCGSNTNPTCGQFVAGLKTAILSNLSHIGKSGNCENDNNTIIHNFDTFLSVSQSQPTNTSTETEFVVEDMPEIREEDIEEGNAEIQACAYVCGFIVKKIKNECKTCHKTFLTQTMEPQHLFVECREYNELKKSLNYVTKPMIACVECCATLVNKILKENGHTTSIKKNIKVNIISKINFDFLNDCVEHKEANIEHIINSVFNICTKRFCILKNRSFSQEASAAALNRKMKIILHK